METTTARPSPFRWRNLLSGAALVLVAATAALAIWLRSDADLRAVEREATALGIPIRWEQTGRVPAPTERVARWARIVALLGHLKAYEAGYGAAAKPAVPKPGEPIPVEMGACHAALDAVRLAAFEAELDALGDQVVVRDEVITFKTMMPSITQYRQLATLLRDRIMLAGDHEVAAQALRAIDAVSTQEAVPLVALQVRNASESIVARAISYRLADLRRMDDGRVHAALLRLADQKPEQLRRTSEAEWLTCLASFRGGEPVHHALGLKSPMGSIVGSFVARCGRAGALRHHLRWLTALEASSDPKAWIAAGASLTSEFGTRPRWAFWHWMAGLLTPAFEHIVKNHVRGEMQLRLLAAELRDQPWPDDDFGTGPLKRVERDGGTVAAYSVGPDGVDDGCHAKKDQVFELYGTVAPAKPAP